MNPKISIVIVNWNTKVLLHNCLESIASLTPGLALEVIVVDNGSTDGSVEMCERLFPEIRLIINDRNVGFARANNQGISAGRGEAFLFLNSDTVISLGDSIEKMYRRMQEDPSIGVLGCRLIRRDGKIQPSCLRFPSLKTVTVERLLLYKLSGRFPQTGMEPPYRGRETECDWIPGACMLIRRKALETAGLFNPNIWMYGEEMELCYRIKSAGWRVIFDPGASVIHLGGESWREKKYSATLLKMIGLLFFFQQHSSIWTYILVFLLCIIGAALRVLIWGVLYPCRRKGRAHALMEIRANLTFLRRVIKYPRRETRKVTVSNTR